MENQTLLAPRLPALQDVHFNKLQHRGRALQLDVWTGGCPQLSRLEFNLDESFPQTSERQQWCSLLHLGRLAHLTVLHDSQRANLGFQLPASLTHLRFSGVLWSGEDQMDFFWALQEAIRCVTGGAQLHALHVGCTEAVLQPARWGASLHEQYGQLGGQLSGLKELEVRGIRVPLLTALSAFVSSAPSLTRLVIRSAGFLRIELPPICSASLESIEVVHDYHYQASTPPVVLTLQPGCTQLREVLVQHSSAPQQGAVIKIRSHCRSESIVPLEVGALPRHSVGVRFLPGSVWGAQWHTVLYACHAPGPGQPPRWGCVVVPEIL